MSSLESIRKQLTDDGWREFKDYVSNADASLCKFFETPHLCVLNSDKPGIQAIISLWDWSKYERHEGMPVTLEVQINANTSVCSYTIKAHSHENVAETLAEIPRLLTAWEAINDAQ